MIALRLILPFLLLCFLVATCARDLSDDGLIRVELTEEMRTTSLEQGQHYWTPDSATWAAFVAQADSIVTIDALVKVYQPDGAVLQFFDRGGEMRSPFPLPGLEIKIDTLDNPRSILRSTSDVFVKARIRAGDARLAGDSVRIGLIRIEGKAFAFSSQPDTTYYPDYLLLTAPGTDVTPVSLVQRNVGPVTRQTVLRHGRRHYALRTIAPDYAYLELEPLADGRGLPLAAEIETTYKSVPVKTLDGQPHTIRRQEGRNLILYFWGGIDQYRSRKIIRLDSLYQTLPPAVRERTDIALINRLNLAADIEAFVAEHNVRLPVYQTSANTCRLLNCHPRLPYFVGVNERGRIWTYYGQTDELTEMLEGMSAPE